MCRVGGVDAAVGAREIDVACKRGALLAIHKASGGTYGATRVRAELITAAASTSATTPLS